MSIIAQMSQRIQELERRLEAANCSHKGLETLYSQLKEENKKLKHEIVGWMNWVKEFDETDSTWVILDVHGVCQFVFYDENMADLMLFCLERVVA